MTYSEKNNIGQESHSIIISGSVYIVGDPPIILKNSYDFAQLWFDFMRGTVFKKNIEEDSPPPVKKKNNTYVYIEDIYRKLYSTDGSYANQLVLPFIEGKRITNSEFTKMKADGFRAWDKDSKGDIYGLNIETPETRGNIEEWCKNNCKRRFYVTSNKKIFFQDENDFIIARLRF